MSRPTSPPARPSPAQRRRPTTSARCCAADAGDPVHLFNGRDGEWQARIAALRRDRLCLTVETQRRPQQPEPDLWLVFALLKRDATDLVVQKATELGVVGAACPSSPSAPTPPGSTLTA